MGNVFDKAGPDNLAAIYIVGEGTRIALPFSPNRLVQFLRPRVSLSSFSSVVFDMWLMIHPGALNGRFLSCPSPTSPTGNTPSTMPPSPTQGSPTPAGTSTRKPRNGLRSPTYLEETYGSDEHYVKLLGDEMCSRCV